MRFIAIVLLGGLLGGCGRSAPPMLAGGKPVEAWVAALKSPDPLERKKAVEKLGNVGTANPAALPAILGALRDADPRVRFEAVAAVMKFGAAGKEAMPILAELRQDSDSRVADAATKALARLGEKGR